MKKGDANISDIEPGDKVVFKDPQTILLYKNYNIIYGIVSEFRYYSNQKVARIKFFNHKGIEVVGYLARIGIKNTELIYYNEQRSQS